MTLLQDQALPWHVDPALRAWATAVFEYYSLKRGYQLELTRQVPTACVSHDHRVVLLNPQPLQLPSGAPVRHLPADPDELDGLIVEGVLAHEAVHAVYTQGTLPDDARLAWLANALEDERAERLLTRDLPTNRGELLFEFIGDIIAESARPNWRGEVLEGCLMWRFTHDLPEHERWSPAPAQLELWQRVRPLVEAAWRAADYPALQAIAVEILALLPEDRQPDPNLPIPQASGANAPDQTPQGGGEGTEDSGAGSEPSERPHSRGEDQVGTPQENEDAADMQQVPSTSKQPSQGQNSAPPAPAAPPRPVRPGHPPVRPTTPPLDQEQLLSNVQRYAARLAPVLRPEDRPAFQQPHRSRGRFDYARHVQGRERVYQRRSLPGRPQPITLRGLLDVSASMAGQKLLLGKLAMLMLYQAARLVGSDASIHAFNTASFPLVSERDAEADANRRLRTLSADGGTLLAPALRTLLELPVTAESLCVAVIISDGELTDRDLQACRAVLTLFPAVHMLPVVIGVSDMAVQGWKTLFPRTIVARSPAQLVQDTFAHLTALRQKLTT